MRTRELGCAAVLGVGGLATAQKVKTKKEAEAVQAIHAEPDDRKIAEVDALVTKFADTEFKSWALQAARIAEHKGDGRKWSCMPRAPLKRTPRTTRPCC